MVKWQVEGACRDRVRGLRVVDRTAWTMDRTRGKVSTKISLGFEGLG